MADSYGPGDRGPQSGGQQNGGQQNPNSNYTYRYNYSFGSGRGVPPNRPPRPPRSSDSWKDWIWIGLLFCIPAAGITQIVAIVWAVSKILAHPLPPGGPAGGPYRQGGCGELLSAGCGGRTSGGNRSVGRSGPGRAAGPGGGAAGPAPARLDPASKAAAVQSPARRLERAEPGGEQAQAGQKGGRRHRAHHRRQHLGRYFQPGRAGLHDPCVFG